jgi:diguanylate cyclase (GGDEF)-like protein
MNNKKKSGRYLKIILYLTMGLIGWLDYETGTEIRIFPLYFVPLGLLAWLYGLRVSFVAALFATFIWVIAFATASITYSAWYVWVVNFFTQGTAFVFVAVVINKLHESLEHEKSLSRTDPLTGLSNRRSFYEGGEILLKICKREKKVVTLVYIDLDNFKLLNDKLGHKQGDLYLLQVAELLSGNLRESDLIARLGGDEFAVLMPDTDALGARDKMEHIHSRLLDLPTSKTIGVSASIGGVSYPVPLMSLEEMTTSADKVMYKIKESTKNSVLIEQIGT